MNTRKERKFDLEERLIDYAILISDLIEQLPNSKLCNHIGGQLIRSGTSPALNYGEAQSAESTNDFIHKLKIILKELRESNICLKMLLRKSYPEIKDLIIAAQTETNELISIFVKSIQTAKTNSTKK
jgi:four helix bundle protein